MTQFIEQQYSILYQELSRESFLEDISELEEMASIESFNTDYSFMEKCIKKCLILDNYPKLRHIIWRFFCAINTTNLESDS